MIGLYDCLHKLHFPQSDEDIKVAHKRYSFQELFEIALKVQASIFANKTKPAPNIQVSPASHNEFLTNLPFELTQDQANAITETIEDLQKAYPTKRLINGDVGAGKTVVAAGIINQVLRDNKSAIIMAPTTILANQHFESLSKFFKGKIELCVSGDAEIKAQSNVLIIGTQAILHSQELPEDTALLIVDEEHRFGVKQRNQIPKLKFNDLYPHYISMTATPIPRTLTNIIYGDMKVSMIKQLPSKRKPISSRVVEEHKLQDCLNWIANQCREENKQAYIIYPLVDKSDELELVSAIEAYDQLTESIFKDIKVGLMHGKLNSQEKDKVLNDFAANKTKILISTTVIEVGIDVPNSSIILINHAERFGLAQLHQLRGRVGRGEVASHCFVSPSKNSTEEALKRLKYFSEHSSGFDVSEYDLKRRGPGEVYGTKQSGIPDLKVADVNDLEMVKFASKLAREELTNRFNN